MNNPLLGHFRRMDVPTTSNACSPDSLFNVHWDDFNRVVVDSLWALLAEESLTDCTLVRLSFSIHTPLKPMIHHASSTKSHILVIISNTFYIFLNHSMYRSLAPRNMFKFTGLYYLQTLLTFVHYFRLILNIRIPL